MKYKNLREVAAAFVTGELDRAHYQLVMEKTSSHLIYRGPLPFGIENGTREASTWRDQKRDEIRTWFKGNGLLDIVDACNAAGIPADWLSPY